MAKRKRDVSFLTFYLMWAAIKGWEIPLLHVRIIHWLDTCKDRIRVLLVFRGAAKSTIYAVYKAYRLYKDRSHLSLIYAADDKLAGKLTRDTLAVLRRHPLCAGMLPRKPGALSFWVTGNPDARNPSMEAVGINSNSTGSRANDADFDDIEVPKNIKTAEARRLLREKIEEPTHILIPGWQKTYVGTPHTHDSIYAEQIKGGAAVLKIALFEYATRYENTKAETRYRFPHPVGPDGLYVIAGIGKPAKILVEGVDYLRDGDCIVFEKPPMIMFDIYSYCSWPERFTRAEIELKRKETKTINGWDSQYMLEAKPIGEVRLDPNKIILYNVEPKLKIANKTAFLYLGNAKIVGMAARWDPSAAKIKSDVSSFGILLQDDRGRRYIHRAISLTGEVAEFNDEATKITGGQVFQICDLIEKFHIPRITVETNGVGAFAPAVLRAAIKQRKLICGVAEEPAIENKNKKILEAIEPLLLSGMLWAHTDVMEGPTRDQMKDFAPDKRDQEDDYIDVIASAISDTPHRIQIQPSDEPDREHRDWRPAGGVHEVDFSN